MQVSNTSCKHSAVDRVEILIQKLAYRTLLVNSSYPALSRHLEIDTQTKEGLLCSPPPCPWSRALGHKIFDLSFTEVAAESHLKLLSTVAQAVKGQGTICWVDCGYVLGTQGILAGPGVCLGPLVAGAEEKVW